MELELHRLRQHLDALSLALGQAQPDDVLRLLSYLQSDIIEAEKAWAPFRAAFTALGALPSMPSSPLPSPQPPRRRRRDERE